MSQKPQILTAEQIATMPITPELAALAREPKTGSGKVAGELGEGSLIWTDPIPVSVGGVVWNADGSLAVVMVSAHDCRAYGLTEPQARSLAAMLLDFLGGKYRDRIPALQALEERARAGQGIQP